ncbi:hypothetical protein LXN57_10950 [Actinoplanes sp. TRM88002]|uniref:Uncharacterized protein n=1 Tax=Paractinoplanes hotanensis TaxID=2906497 RepID=A0ABT0XWB7_9ACTN|nr:hypothetical protein [Actinoplanes hotanensis]
MTDTLTRRALPSPQGTHWAPHGRSLRSAKAAERAAAVRPMPGVHAGQD